MSEPGSPAESIREGAGMHALRNAVNSAGFCVHAAEQLLIAGDIPHALNNLARALRCLERARELLAPTTEPSRDDAP